MRIFWLCCCRWTCCFLSLDFKMSVYIQLCRTQVFFHTKFVACLSVFFNKSWNEETLNKAHYLLFCVRLPSRERLRRCLSATPHHTAPPHSHVMYIASLKLLTWSYYVSAKIPEVRRQTKSFIHCTTSSEH